MPLGMRPYLGPSIGINPSSTKLAKVVADLKAPDEVKTVKNILKWMKTNVSYKLVNKKFADLDFKQVDEIVERGHAECRGFADLFTGLCRAAGIPARSVWGLAILPSQLGGGYASHNWSEVYIRGVGWVPVDPQHPETFGCLPNSNLRIFMDMQVSTKTNEALPMFNLLNMNGEKVQIEESR